MNGRCRYFLGFLIAIQIVSIVIWYSNYRDSTATVVISSVSRSPSQVQQQSCPPPPPEPTERKVEIIERNITSTVTQEQSNKPIELSPGCVVEAYKAIGGYPSFTSANISHNDKWLPLIEDTDWFSIDPSVRFRCNPGHVKTFWEANAAYGRRSGTKKAKATIEAHTNNLLVTKSVLDNLGIHFFLSHGTLLGLYRECDLIGHTSDVDIGIPYKYMSLFPEIIKGMKAAGFSERAAWGTLNRGFELGFSKQGQNIDIFTFYKDVVRLNGQEKEVLWNSMWWKDKLLRRMGFPLTQFVYADFKGQSFLVPKKLKEWIEVDYGTGWGNPIVKWSWYTDPRNYIDESVEVPNTIGLEMEKYGPNLLRNPSFEDLDANGWPRYWNEAKKGSCKYEFPTGNATFHGLRTANISTLAGSSSCMLWQEVVMSPNVNPGQKALVSGWSKLGTIDPTVFAWSNQYSIFWEGWVNSKGRAKNVAYIFGAEFGSQETDWQYSSFVMEPGTEKFVKIKVLVTFGEYIGHAQFDEISLRMEQTCRANCNNNGKCIYGKCYCFEMYYGELCENAATETVTVATTV